MRSLARTRSRIDKFAFRSGEGIELEPLSWKFEVEKFQMQEASR
jgi:hypothetical protein